MYLLVMFAWVPVFGCSSLIAAESREKRRHRRGHLFHEAFWHSLKIDSPENKTAEHLPERIGSTR